MKEEEINEEDKEFLTDIQDLSEEKQNGIIAYMKNREEEQAKQILEWIKVRKHWNIFNEADWKECVKKLRQRK